MRKPHLLPAYESNQRPWRVIFFDSESWLEDKKIVENGLEKEIEVHHPYLITACFTNYKRRNGIIKAEDHWKHYTGRQSILCRNFWKDATDYATPKKPIIIYAHNAGYDMLATKGIIELPKLGFRAVSFFEKGSTYLMDFIHEEENRKISIISTTNYFSGSLKKLGELFKLEKMDFTQMALFRNKPPRKSQKEKSKIYCTRDVEIIKLAMESFYAFIDAQDLGGVGRTLSSQAFNAYRHRFMDVQIGIHANGAVIDAERESYTGGRTECWRKGILPSDKTYYKLDINSMYPFVMRYDLPCQLQSYHRFGNSPKTIKDYLEYGFLIVARVTIKTDIPCIPLKTSERLIFPVGEFETTLATPELKLASDRGLITEVREMALYKKAPIFSKYVDYFYNLRQQIKARKDNPHAGDDIMDTFYKLFLNTLYGKMGQQKENFIEFGQADPIELSFTDYVEFNDDGTIAREGYLKTFGGTTFLHWRDDVDEAQNSFPAIASHVTSYARAYLWELIEKAGLKNVLYMDTDSLFCTEEGYTNLKDYISDTQLGKLKLEDTTNLLELRAPKDYTFGDEKKLKGVKKTDIQIDENTYLTSHWGKLSTFTHKGYLLNYYTEKRFKTMSREYKKGNVEEDGGITPYKLEMKN